MSDRYSLYVPAGSFLAFANRLPLPLSHDAHRNTAIETAIILTKIVGCFKFDFDIYQRDMSKLRDLCTTFLNHFQKWEMAGKGLYLWSKTPGSGKTFLACCLAKSVMMKYDLQMRFVTAPD